MRWCAQVARAALGVWLGIALGGGLGGCQREAETSLQEYRDPDPPPVWRARPRLEPFPAWQEQFPEGTRFEVDFSGKTQRSRASRDFRLSLNLSTAEGVDFDFRCDDLALVSRFTLYLKSGRGWYVANFYALENRAWYRVQIPKAQMTEEGSCAGWNQISAIRVAAWRAGSGKTTCYLRAFSPLAAPPAKPGIARRLLFQQTMREWLARRQAPPAEHRAWWCHTPSGLAGQTWAKTVAQVKASGFNALYPNLAWGGLAFYPSKVLPVAPLVARQGDQLKACLRACRQQGVECHVWKICWYLGNSLSSRFNRRMKREGRLQKTFEGKVREDWLCPSHPENLKLELQAVEELARYHPDGIQLDYIRYPNAECCFCETCHTNFEAQLGQTVESWPQAVRTDAELARAWQAFRRATMNAAVSNIAAQVRARAPEVRLSAAVYAAASSGRESVAQDWVLWCQQGWLDFACPMNYFADAAEFKATFREQLRLVEGRTPLYPGIGLAKLPENEFEVIEVVRQIEAARALGGSGFAIFGLDARAARLLPDLARGPTAP